MWVALDIAVERNRKVLDLRARMRWSANDALARLVRLLVTVREQAPSGDLTGWSAVQIAGAMEPDGLGEPDVLLRELVATGLLIEQDGRLLVKGWAERNGDYLRQSSRERQRVAAGKARAAAASRDEHGRYRPGSQPAPASDGPATAPASHQRPALAGPAGPAQPVAGASTSQRRTSDSPAQPAEQYRSSTGARAKDSDAASISLRSIETLSACGRPVDIAANRNGTPQPDTRNDDEAVALARAATRAVAAMVARVEPNIPPTRLPAGSGGKP